MKLFKALALLAIGLSGASNAMAVCTADNLDTDYGFSGHAFAPTYVFTGNIHLDKQPGLNYGVGTYDARLAKIDGTVLPAEGGVKWWISPNCNVNVAIADSPVLGSYDLFTDLIRVNPNRLVINRMTGMAVASVTVGRPIATTSVLNVWPNAKRSVAKCNAETVRRTYVQRFQAFNTPDSSVKSFVGLGRATFRLGNSVRWGYYYSQDGSENDYVSGPATASFDGCYMSFTEKLADGTTHDITVNLRELDQNGVAIGGSGFIVTTPPGGNAYVAPFGLNASAYSAQ